MTPPLTAGPPGLPTATKIAFASNRRGSYEIYTMNSDGSGVRKVANNEGRATAPQWTKDAEYIFFSLCKKVDFSRLPDLRGQTGCLCELNVGVDGKQDGPAFLPGRFLQRSIEA